ncbi:hypothetical protein OE749_14495 [Aestuariibacter sp. AA17]|uniref:Uncharacterized protein n=1 Tax=Fluctibacter corallii TaxID=2984329 RepID=A0ABT3ABD6_9ALTE|nr:hypothetical protein [Aestuariibacter sp. AA17]MCV2885905.1 hypothetical protein [Aestuariibacter sp. AA17]
MSCLTRKLQQSITRYLQRHDELVRTDSPENVRGKLINQGLCPSDVTQDQIRLIMQNVRAN